MILLVEEVTMLKVASNILLLESNNILILTYSSCSKRRVGLLGGAALIYAVEIGSLRSNLFYSIIVSSRQ